MELAERLKDWRNEHPSWLFVFDNVENEEIVKPFVSELHQGHILLTARKQELRKLGLTARNMVNVEVFSFAEALTFMRDRLNKNPERLGSSAESAALVERLGRFPLALEQAAAYIQRTQTDCGLTRGYASSRCIIYNNYQFYLG